MYRIAFFGSDLFSLKSFQHVCALHARRPDLVKNIQLVTRKLKPSGRGMKNVVIPPIVEFARQKGVEWREVEATNEFTSLADASNLAVAVSYGRLIPQAYLSTLKFGGLNVHPSLLPQYRGAAPLQWAIMDRQATSGVSVQTLHPTKFDHGQVLWQSSETALNPRETIETLTDKLGELGAQGLVHTLENCDLLNPVTVSPGREACHAPLIDRKLYRINFTLPAIELDARGRALEKLFFEQKVEQTKKKARSLLQLRVNLADFDTVDRLDDAEGERVEVGNVRLAYSVDGTPLLALKLRDGFLGARTVTVQGFKTEPALNYFEQRMKRKLPNVALI